MWALDDKKKSENHQLQLELTAGVGGGVGGTGAGVGPGVGTGVGAGVVGESVGFKDKSEHKMWALYG